MLTLIENGYKSNINQVHVNGLEWRIHSCNADSQWQRNGGIFSSLMALSISSGLDWAQIQFESVEER